MKATKKHNLRLTKLEAQALLIGLERYAQHVDEEEVKFLVDFTKSDQATQSIFLALSKITR